MVLAAFVLSPWGARTAKAAAGDQFICGTRDCGHVYDPAEGESEQGIPPAVPFLDLPAEWKCPVCGAPKDSFRAYLPY